MNPPNPLTGSNPIVSWANKLRAAVVAQRIRGGRGIRVNQSTDGVTISVEPGRGGSPAVESTHVEMFKLQSLGTGSDANLLRCFTWDGTNTGTTSIYILKPYKLWNHARLLIDNVDTLYSYGVDFNYRQAAYSNPPFGDVTENQIIVPRYTVPYAAYAPSGRPGHTGDIIHAGKLATAQTVNGRTIEYVDLNVDGRAWARQRVS